MNVETSAAASAPVATGAVRSRDADGTRLRLLDAAGARFARDGYAATTVRDIASDAGVNVALINRYFTSKEGLFAMCLTRAAEDLGRADTEDVTIDEILGSVVKRAMDSHDEDGRALQMLLLLRTSGDDQADAVRRRTLQTFAERIAAAAGWRGSGEGDQDLLLRAQIALATALGIVQLRSAGIAPLTEVSSDQLTAPLRDVLDALLT